MSAGSYNRSACRTASAPNLYAAKSTNGWPRAFTNNATSTPTASIALKMGQRDRCAACVHEFGESSLKIFAPARYVRIVRRQREGPYSGGYVLVERCAAPIRTLSNTGLTTANAARRNLVSTGPAQNFENVVGVTQALIQPGEETVCIPRARQARLVA